MPSPTSAYSSALHFQERSAWLFARFDQNDSTKPKRAVEGRIGCRLRVSVGCGRHAKGPMLLGSGPLHTSGSGTRAFPIRSRRGALSRQVPCHPFSCNR
jgi:hypothetical protein